MLGLAACALTVHAARASQATGVAQAPAPTAAAPNKVLPVVMFTEWRDPREGAFTISVPETWTVTGGTARRSAVDIRLPLSAATADGRVQMSFDDPDIVPRQEPNRMTPYREGQVIQGAWGGPLLIASFRTGAQYAQEYVSTRVCPKAEFTNVGDLKPETDQMNAEVAPLAMAAGANVRAAVGEAYFTCGTDLGYFTATTILASPRGAGVSIWEVNKISGFIVKQSADAAYAMYILHTMNASFKLDPRWKANAERDTQNLTASVTRMQNAMAANLVQQAASRASQTRSSVVGRNNIDVMSGWEARNKAHDAGTANRDAARRGVTTTVDPVWGSRAVSNDYNYYWTRPDGSIVGTTTTTPPDYSNGWRLMTTPK